MKTLDLNLNQANNPQDEIFLPPNFTHMPSHTQNTHTNRLGFGVGIDFRGWRLSSEVVLGVSALK